MKGDTFFDKLKINGRYISEVCGGIFLLQIFFYLYNDLYTEFFDMLSMKVESQQELKMILDNL